MQVIFYTKVYATDRVSMKVVVSPEMAGCNSLAPDERITIP